MGEVISGPKPDREDYKPQNIDQDLRARYLGIIDKYMADHNMTSAIPRESRPYELRSPEERMEWRGATGNPVTRPGTIQQPSLNDGLYFNSEPQPAMAPQPTNARLKGMAMPQAEGVERAVSSQAIPASPVAPRMDQVPLTTNTAFFQEDERRKQDEFNKVKDFVYRDRRR